MKKTNSALRRKCDSQSGFTLLEVIVALAITGFVLGGLFSLVGGSKQLGWRSEESLLRATRLRAAINFALLENEYRNVELILEDESFQIVPKDILEDPERKTQPSIFTLQGFEIVDDDRDEVIAGSRWVQLDLPR
ncbi:MAG: type II secretion system GspH family protein [Pseudomonadales bacterium]|nr:type II secretion system GspH family protein [Pseudomonadales bacterium]